MSKATSIRKPYNDRPGYVASRVAELGGHVVIYDRTLGGVPTLTVAHRWVIVHEASGQHTSVKDLKRARVVLESVAACRTLRGLNRLLPGEGHSHLVFDDQPDLDE